MDEKHTLVLRSETKVLFVGLSDDRVAYHRLLYRERLEYQNKKKDVDEPNDANFGSVKAHPRRGTRDSGHHQKGGSLVYRLQLPYRSNCFRRNSITQSWGHR